MSPALRLAIVITIITFLNCIIQFSSHTNAIEHFQLSTAHTLINIMSSDARPRIVKLTDDNYVEWKGDVTGYSMSHGLQDFINPNHIPIVAGLSDESKTRYDEYLLCRGKAAGIMYSHLTEQFRIEVEAADLLSDPVGIWKHLKNKFQSSSADSKGRAFRSFLRIPFTTLGQYIKDVRKGISLLEACEMPTTNPLIEPLLCEGIVFKLPDSLDTLVQLITDKRSKETGLTMKTVLEMLDAHLVNFNERHQHDETVALSSTVALSQTWSYPYPRCTNGRHNPSVTNHPADRCWIQHPNLRPPPRQSRSQNPRARATTAIYVDDVIQTTALSCLTSSATNIILLDSACSDHMVSDKNLFETYEAINSKVSLADGETIHIAGKGNIAVQSLGKKLILPAFHVPTLGNVLISMGCLLNDGFHLTHEEGIVLLTKEGSGGFTGRIKNRVIELDITIDNQVIPIRYD